MYATDAILSTIMCCSRSSNSWDVVVQKIAGKLFFDKRDDSEFGKISIFVVHLNLGDHLLIFDALKCYCIIKLLQL